LVWSGEKVQETRKVRNERGKNSGEERRKQRAILRKEEAVSGGKRITRSSLRASNHRPEKRKKDGMPLYYCAKSETRICGGEDNPAEA